MQALGCLFFVIIFAGFILLFVGVAFFQSVFLWLKQLFGIDSSTRTPLNDDSSDASTDDQHSSHFHFHKPKKKKIIADDEGEYVPFEDIPNS